MWLDRQHTVPFNTSGNMATVFSMMGFISDIDYVNYMVSVTTNNGLINNVRIPFVTKNGEAFDITTPQLGDYCVIGADSQQNYYIVSYFSFNPVDDMTQLLMRPVVNAKRMSSGDMSEVLISTDILAHTWNGNTILINSDGNEPTIVIQSPKRIILNSNDDLGQSIVMDPSSITVSMGQEKILMTSTGITLGNNVNGGRKDLLGNSLPNPSPPLTPTLQAVIAQDPAVIAVQNAENALNSAIQTVTVPLTAAVFAGQAVANYALAEANIKLQQTLLDTKTKLEQAIISGVDATVVQPIQSAYNIAQDALNAAKSVAQGAASALSSLGVPGIPSVTQLQDIKAQAISNAASLAGQTVKV